MIRARALHYAVAALLLGGAAYLFAVGNSFGQRIEGRVLDAASFTTTPPAPLGLITPTSVAVTLLALVLLALLLHGIRRATAIALFSSVAIVASQLLKESWLDRPQLFELAATNSFPSGHMTAACVIAGGLLWAVRGSARAILAIMSALLLAVLSCQLLHFGWHRPSDLLGAHTLAVCSVALIAWLGPRGSRAHRSVQRPPMAAVSRLSYAALNLISLLTLVGGVLVLAFAAYTSNDAILLLGSACTLIGSSGLTARALARLCP